MKAAGEKGYTGYAWTSIQMTVEFSSVTMEDRTKWFHMLKGKNCQLRILYPEKLSFRSAGKTKIFSDEEKHRIWC